MDRAGQETFIMNMYRHIDRTKIQFDFIVHTEEKCDYDDEITGLGGRIYRVPTKKQNLFKNLNEIRKIVRDGKYKIVHRHTEHAMILVDLLAAKCGGADTLITHSHSTSTKHSLSHIMLRPLLNRITTLKIACSKPAGIWLFGRHSGFLTINNAIDAKAYSYNKTIRYELRRELGLDDKLVLGHIGRFTYAKNHEFLLEIFCEVLKINDQAVLMLIGDGELRKSIEKKALNLKVKEKIMFTGIIGNVNEYLQAIDVFVFPSIYEGLGIVAIEAQASGIPCIVSETLPEEISVTDLVSFLSLKESPKVWADKIIEAVQKNVRRDTYNDISNANYDIVDNARQLEKIYIGCYSNGRTRKECSIT
jgi:glycosyltransferase involved in cell wall biosynthesis